jgi:hypothetical protein
MNVNPDTMNFYMCMQDINTIKFQMLILMDSGCLILCRKLYFRRDKIYSQLQLHYSKEIIFYFIAVKPIRNALDLSLSKSS